MFKMIICFERQGWLSRQQCHDYLQENHANLIKNTEEFKKYLSGYVQNFVVDSEPYGYQVFQPDAIAQVWFEAFEVAGKAFSEPKYWELVRPDEDKFSNSTRLLCVGTQERIIWTQIGQGVHKLFRFLVSRTGTEIDDEAKLYREDMVQTKLDHYKKIDTVYRYIQNWPLKQAQAAFTSLMPIFCVEEFWLSDEIAAEDKQSFMRDIADFQYLPDMVDKEKSFIVFAAERPVISSVLEKT